MLQHILLDLRIGCPILKFGHIHIFQRELNPNLFRVDFALGKQDNRLDVEEYWNLIAARTADVEDPDTAAIYEKVVEAFQSSATEDVFNNTFGGYFIAVGWDQDLINQ